MKNKEELLSWLLEEENPEVRLRTLTEYFDYDNKNSEVIRTKELLLQSEMFEAAMEKVKSSKPWERYAGLVCLAEWGLTREDVNIDQYVDTLYQETGFKMMCGEGLLLRNLVKLGFYSDDRIKEEIHTMCLNFHKDGGVACISKNKKINDPKKEHKSCIKISLGYLLLLAELKRIGVTVELEAQLVHYFTKRNLFYRTDDMKTVIMPLMTDTYYPPDAIQVGVQNLLYALILLGQGNSEAVSEAFQCLNKAQEENGAYRLTKTKTVPAFKPGRKNKANKWITLYAFLSEKMICK